MKGLCISLLFSSKDAFGLVLNRLCEAVREPDADGTNFFVGEIFVTRHVGSGKTEFDDFGETTHPTGSIFPGREMREGSSCKFRREYFETCLPCLAGTPLSSVTGCTVGGEQARTF